MCKYSDDTKYKCPHESLKDSEYCIFHLHDDEKDIDEFNKRIEEIFETDEDLIYFNGFYFPPNTDFVERIFQTTVFFFNAVFSGNANFAGAEFSKEANFKDVKFLENADFTDAEFLGDVDFRISEFSGDADFKHATFSKYADFTITKFLRDADFAHATFSGYASFVMAEFSGEANFTDTTFSEYAGLGATFSGNVNFTISEFLGDADFTHATFSENADFAISEFSGEANFTDTTFSGDSNFVMAKFLGNADFAHVTFSENADFTISKFLGETNFTDTTFLGDSNFNNAELTGKFVFIPKKSETIIFKDTYFSDNVRIKADMSKCSFANSNIERIDMTDSIWIVDSKPKNSYSALIEWFKNKIGISDTSIIIWEERQGKLSSNWSKLESIYRRLKQSSQKFGDNDTAGKFYYQEMECKRKQLKGIGKFFWYFFYKKLCGYGERPFNVIWASGLIIFVSSLFFFYWGIELSESVVLNLPARLIDYKPIFNFQWVTTNFDKVFRDWLVCLYTSVITFTTLGYGDVNPIGWSRIVASVEAGIGIIMTAVFIFVFTRKMLR